MNIYEQLGASPYESFGVFAKPLGPYYHSDGSTNDKTKLWALQKLGFIDTEKIKFNSWCEKRDRSALVPFSVSSGGYTCYLSPLQPREFIISYGSIANKTLNIPRVFKSKDIGLALLEVMAEVNIFKAKFSSFYRTENPHYSSDFSWSEQNKTWLFKGMSVKLIQFALADNTRGFFLNF